MSTPSDRSNGLAVRRLGALLALVALSFWPRVSAAARDRHIGHRRWCRQRERGQNDRVAGEVCGHERCYVAAPAIFPPRAIFRR